MKTEENHTGVTVIVPGPDNAFAKHYTAAAYIHNGFGKSAGVVQVEELGTLETPIALTNTLNVGKVTDALIGYILHQEEERGRTVRSVNVLVGETNDSQISNIGKREVEEEHVLAAIADADRIVVLEAGRVVTCGTPEAVLTADLLRAVFRVEADIAPSTATSQPHIRFLP